MKKIYLSLIIFFFVQTNSFSGEYLNRFANCLMQNTTDRDKVVLVRWMFSAVAQHSALESEFNISVEKSTNHEIAVADYMQYILGSICLEEAKNVLPALMHNVGQLEYQGHWARFWVDLGTSDAMAIDVLINVIKQINGEMIQLDALFIGGVNDDWLIEDHPDSVFPSKV